MAAKTKRAVPTLAVADTTLTSSSSEESKHGCGKFSHSGSTVSCPFWEDAVTKVTISGGVRRYLSDRKPKKWLARRVMISGF